MIAIGDKVHVKLALDSSSLLFTTKVAEIEDDIYILDAPAVYGDDAELPLENNKVCFSFITGSGVISYEGVITQIDKSGLSLKVKLLSCLIKTQRRDAFRLSYILPFNFCQMEDEKANTENMVCSSGVIKDLSIGGIRFSAREDIPERAFLKCFIEFNTEVYTIVGQILHKQEFPRSKYNYQYRVQFVNLKSFDEDKINKFIFEEKRRLIAETRKVGNI